MNRDAKCDGLVQTADIAQHPPWYHNLTAVLILLAWLWFNKDDPAEDTEFFHAYIGPGAGIALVGSFMALLLAFVSALLALITWPIRWIYQTIRCWKLRSRAHVQRVVVLGLDGLDPLLVEQYLEAGHLPNLAKLRENGTYTKLGTTWPPLSPVAWSSFSTGVNPGKHNIFDFINRSLSTYRPQISSVRIHAPRRSLCVGKYRLPLSRPYIERLRKSKPFWSVLGEAGVFSSILRVPITFPPDRFRGVQLAAMCVPDLRGTQGVFTHFVEFDLGNDEWESTGGEQVTVTRVGECVKGWLDGPRNPLHLNPAGTRIPFIVRKYKNEQYLLSVANQCVVLSLNEYSQWVTLTFRLAPGVKVRGVCRFLLQQFDQPFKLYCTPVNIDATKPLMPISHPTVYSTYLAKKYGSFATLGLAEDTKSLSEGVIDESHFLKQTYDIDEERQKMFFDSLNNVSRGLVVCVFDAPDRIQHMFWRFSDDGHPAQGSDQAKIDANRDVIKSMYARMDDLVGRTRAVIGQDTALLVLSDHGFKSFRRGVDLNAWLLKHGYLKLKDGVDVSHTPHLGEVDWSASKAYSIGLAGIFINLRGREKQGIVAPGEEEDKIADEICRRLTGLVDDLQNTIAIHQAVRRAEVYHGPYIEEAPDIIVGYNIGYRVSWDSANGKCSNRVFSDNKQAWSGDHCVHPDLVPGVLFSNLKLRTEQASIIDLAPTVLDLLGVRKPSYFDGETLLGSSQ